MRVANKTMYDSIIRDLGRASGEMVDAHEVVSTAKKINRLSDDPVGLVTVLDLRSSLANIHQIERNINVGRSWLRAGESAMIQTEDILSKTKELCVQYASSNVSASDRSNAVDIVDGYLDQVLSLSNSKAGGRYLFGGTNTETAPFALNAAGTQVTYSGNETPFSIKIAQDSNVAIGRDGETIYGENWDDSNIFKTLIDLKTYLLNNDVTNMQGTMDKLDAHFETIHTLEADMGGKMIRLEVKEKIIHDLEFSTTDRKSQLEDADITEAIMNLNSKELAYNAALSSSAKIMRLSLMDYV